jgi:ATP-dependent Clp endopeptidase proteolytic subunit ClpP
MKTDFLQIENRTGRLKLNDGVHKGSADKLIEELDRLYGPSAVAAQMVLGDIVCVADDALESVEVEINSPGGSVFEGQRIYNALRDMSARGVAVTTTVNGLAASMGSVILMAGDQRRMTNGSRIMIHEASTIAWGDARTMRKNADLLEGISSEIAGIYAARTGGDADSIRQLMIAETWMTADQAKENGFVDVVMKDGKAKAEFDTNEKGMSIFARIFQHDPEAVAKIEAIAEENETLRADLETAQARVAELTALAEVNAQLQADLADAQAKLAEAETLANENAQTIADLAEQAEVTSEKVAVRAAELLASQGHPAPVELTGDGGETKSALDRFNELTGEEATRFYNLNRKAIIAEQFKSQS